MRTYQTRASARLQRKSKVSGAMLMLALICSWTTMLMFGYLYGASVCVQVQTDETDRLPEQTSSGSLFGYARCYSLTEA